MEKCKCDLCSGGFGFGCGAGSDYIADRLRKLQDERDKYKKALETIADATSAINETRKHSYRDFELRLIARGALGYGVVAQQASVKGD